MGGSLINEFKDSEKIWSVVLVGRTGDGKSATGNSILGRKAFISKAAASGVTSTCELQTSLLKGGQTINVIDTPGFFNISEKSDLIGEELIKCIDLAKNGIHAILFVVSVRNRFSQEEATAVHNLQTIFGSNIVNYIIVVFTGGDELEDNDETLEDYLSNDCPEPLKDIMRLCKDRYVIFDNKTKNERKKYSQIQDLLSQVETIVLPYDGKPFMHELLKLQKQEKELRDKTKKFDASMSEITKAVDKSHEEKVELLSNLVESGLRDRTARLEQQVEEAKTAKLKVEERAEKALIDSNKEMQRLREDIERTQKLNAEERAKQAQIINSNKRTQTLLPPVDTESTSPEVSVIDKVMQEALINSDKEVQNLRHPIEKMQKVSVEEISREEAPIIINSNKETENPPKVTKRTQVNVEEIVVADESLVNSTKEKQNLLEDIEGIYNVKNKTRKNKTRKTNAGFSKLLCCFSSQ